ncbi:MAG: hypothetical protein RSB59_03825, partial [Clostridia bacterium]
KWYLEKKVGEASANITNAIPNSPYLGTMTSGGTATASGGIIVKSGETIDYALATPQKIILDQTEAQKLEIIRTYLGGTVISSNQITGASPIFDVAEMTIGNRKQKAVVLVDNDSNAVFPMTKADCVIMPDGTTVEHELNRIEKEKTSSEDVTTKQIENIKKRIETKVENNAISIVYPQSLADTSDDRILSERAVFNALTPQNKNWIKILPGDEITIAPNKYYEIRHNWWSSDAGTGGPSPINLLKYGIHSFENVNNETFMFPTISDFYYQANTPIQKNDWCLYVYKKIIGSTVKLSYEMYKNYQPITNGYLEIRELF